MDKPVNFLQKCVIYKFKKIGPGLTRKLLTLQKDFSSGKHSSLFLQNVILGEKYFCDLDNNFL